MTINKVKSFLLLSSSIIIVGILYFLFMYTNLFFPSEKRIKNSEQLKTEILKESLSLLSNQDTLHLATRGLFICGNDASLQYNVTIYERFKQLAFYIENTPYTKLTPLYGEYSLNQKTIIYGDILNDEYSYNDYNFSFKQDTISPKKSVYDFSYDSVKKDTVIVEFTDSYLYYNQIEKKTKMTFINANSTWHKE